MSEPADIVGHKTLADGSHLPLTRAEADELIARADEYDHRMAEQMLDEATALKVLTDAFHRLKKLGWNDAIYCPKDGSSFDVIEAGSSGIHSAHYEGEWPRGTWWIANAGDLWPSRPILYRVTEAEKAKWAALKAAIQSPAREAE
jgi:hypothetical protein